MKNWETLEPDKYALVGGHRFTKGRARPIDRIIIHHNAANNWSTEQVRDLWNNSREASAHYQVEADGTIGQLVNDWDVAWHAANADINARSIGIEHANISGPPRWQISDKTIEEGAHLVAALCHAYKLGRPTWGKNVFPHSQFTSTSCPHQLDVGGEDHATYMRRAQWWYDNPTGGAKKTAPAPAAKPQPKEQNVLTPKYFTDYITGYLGPQIDALQEVWRQLRGPDGKGWPQLGQNSKGQNLTLVDSVAALRNDVAELRKIIEEKGTK
ncbi:peptidoglycan recognition protein family protein [Corynebacterium sp. 11254D000AR]